LRLLCHASTSAVRTSAFPADEPIDSQKQHVLAVMQRRFLNADRVLTSPALRARQTAEALQLDATIEPMLRDCDYGRWAGLSSDQVQAQEPDLLADWLRDPGAAPHGGEAILSLIERVGAWLDGQSAVPGTTIAVTHASVIRAAVICAIGAPPQSFWRIDIAPLSITRLSGAHGRWNLSAAGCAVT
jgi:broad specificity phosphatase PhoE